MSLKMMANQSPHHSILLRTSCDLLYGRVLQVMLGEAYYKEVALCSINPSLYELSPSLWTREKKITASSPGHNQMYSVAFRRPGDTSLQTGVKFILYISRGPYPALKLSQDALKLHAISCCVRESVIETRGEVIIHHRDEAATVLYTATPSGNGLFCGGKHPKLLPNEHV